MISNYLENINTLPEQVEINKQDIKNLKNYIKEAYKCTVPLDQEPQSVQLSATNAPSGTSTGWLLDTNANLFKIVGNDTVGAELLVIIFYCSLKGAQGAQGIQGETGNGITGIEEISDEIVGTQTLTTLRVHYTNGESNDFVVYAENGIGGAEYMHHIYLRVNEEQLQAQMTFELRNKNSTVLSTLPLLANALAEQGFRQGNYFRYHTIAGSDTDNNIIINGIGSDIGGGTLYENYVKIKCVKINFTGANISNFETTVRSAFVLEDVVTEL